MVVVRQIMPASSPPETSALYPQASQVKRYSVPIFDLPPVTDLTPFLDQLDDGIFLVAPIVSWVQDGHMSLH